MSSQITKLDDNAHTVQSGNEVEMSNKLFVFCFFQAYIIRWLLNHDPSQRPTAQELLASDYLPPPQMEEAELNEVLR